LLRVTFGTTAWHTPYVGAQLAGTRLHRSVRTIGALRTPRATSATLVAQRWHVKQRLSRCNMRLTTMGGSDGGQTRSVLRGPLDARADCSGPRQPACWAGGYRLISPGTPAPTQQSTTSPARPRATCRAIRRVAAASWASAVKLPATTVAGANVRNRWTSAAGEQAIWYCTGCGNTVARPARVSTAR